MLPFAYGAWGKGENDLSRVCPQTRTLTELFKEVDMGFPVKDSIHIVDIFWLDAFKNGWDVILPPPSITMGWLGGWMRGEREIHIS